MNKLVAFGVAAFAAVSAFAAELPEPVNGVITIDIDADVELVDSEGQVVTSADWRFSFSADRKTLKFGKARGLVVLVQ